MIFTDKMKNMKIYKIPTFLPTMDGNKKKNSAITLLTPNYESSKKLLNHPLFVNKLRYNSYYLDKDVSFLINDKNIEEAVYNEEYSVYQLLTEISSEKRNSLKDSDFGIPSKRKFPLDTEKRVRSAIKFFNYVDKEDEEELASNIKKAMKKFGINDVQVGEKNRFKNYYNESVALTESIMKNEKDILYNKDKFEYGEINLCFITGHSGSGKSTMGDNDKSSECYSLDDVLYSERFSDSNFKEYGDLIYTFFKTSGKKYRIPFKENRREWREKNGFKDKYKDYFGPLTNDFIKYSMKYANSHKDKKYIVEGIQILEYCEPEQFKDYAFYIKGTSMLVSKYRAKKRSGKTNTLKNYLFDEKQLNKFRDYFKKRSETILECKEEPLDNESVILEYKNNISFDSSFSLVKKIVDSLTKEELSHICTGEFKDSPYIIYREVLSVNNKPAAFIDIYSIPKEMNKDEAVIVVACNPKFRKNGYVELLVERAIPIIKKENKIKYLYWETDKSNKASSNIAKKFKFKKAKNFDENDDNYVINLSESYIEESSVKSNFIDNNDFIYNFDKWNNTNNNILYITGMSGSGKSTLSEDLAEKYNAYYVELDYVVLWFMDKYIKKGKQQNVYDKLETLCPQATEFLTSLNLSKYKYRDWNDVKGLAKISRAYISWFENKFANDGNKYIICGAFIFQFIPYDMLIGKPLIIKQNNIFKTLVRRTKREISDAENFKDWMHKLIKHIKMSKNLTYNNTKNQIDVIQNYLSTYNEADDVYLNSIEESNKKIYRYTSNGIGIYEALKNKLGKTEWEKLLKSGELSWLPKPPNKYSKSNRSYFTKLGKEEFEKRNLDLFKNNLDDISLEIIDINNNNIVYKDKYQIITEDVDVLEKSDVLFLSNITPENIVKAYKQLGVSLPDKVACKVHSGEDGNQNYLRPELWSDLINYVNGTVVECNTAYEGARNTTEKHKELIKKHGWDQFDVDIMDEDFDFELPIEKHNIIDKNYVGSHMRNYSSMVVLSHFKGHPMGGFSGALKQLSIGCASSRGKKYIHGFGNADRGDQILADFKGEPTDTNEQLSFINAMADAASSVHNFFKDNIVYINIMSNISVDCDCVAHAEDPCMKDIGILISKDPVAIDKACIDLVYNSNDPGKKHLIERIESRGALNIFNACKNIDFGNTKYNLINLDAEESNDVSNEYANPDNIFELIEKNNSKNIVFDLGGVLLEDGIWRDLIKKAYPDLRDDEIEIFINTYQDFINKSDTANFNNARLAFISNFDNSNMKEKALRAFNVLVDTVYPFDYTEQLLKDLQKKGYKLYYLSNWSNYGFNAMKAHGKLNFLKYFNDGLVSYEVGFLKPDKEIYEIFLKKKKLKPEECIFFDDKPDNCSGAKASGIQSYIWYVSNN